MNPDPFAMSIIRSRRDKEERLERERRDALHRRAVARRRAAKRGGKR